MEYLLDGEPRDNPAWATPGPNACDGVFETIRVRAGRLTLADAHFARLRTGLERLRLEPAADFLERAAQTASGLAREHEDAVLRLVVVAEPAGGGYGRRDPVRLHACHQLRALPTWPAVWQDEGVAVHCCVQALARQPALVGIKHLCRLEQVLAAHECREVGCPEGLVFDTEGILVEGVRSNVFLRIGAACLTPSLAHCGVAGTLRNRLLRDFAAEGVTVHETDLPRERLGEVDELFLCNSVIGVWPVARVAGVGVAVGDWTRRAQQLAGRALGITP